MLVACVALQILPDWQDYFEHPGGIALGESFIRNQQVPRLTRNAFTGLINSSQAIGGVLVRPNSALKPASAQTPYSLTGTSNLAFRLRHHWSPRNDVHRFPHHARRRRPADRCMVSHDLHHLARRS